jgi:hypothetical protein
MVEAGCAKTRSVERLNLAEKPGAGLTLRIESKAQLIQPS